jgi:hypothetical protein
MRAARRDTTRTRTVGCAHVGSSRRACPRARVDERHVRTALAAALRRHRHPRGARASLQREDNIKALLISVASTQATRIKHHDMLTRACAVFLFEHPSVVSNACSFSAALFLSLETSLAGP